MNRLKKILKETDCRSLGILLCFAAANALIWMLLGCRYFTVADLDFHPAGTVYGILLNCGHAGTVGAAMLVFSILLRLIGQKTAFSAAVVLGTLITLLDLANIIVFEQYKFHINPAMISLFCSPAGKELVTFPASTWAVVCLAVAAVAAAEYGLFRLCRKYPCPRTAGAVLAASLVFSGAGHLIHMWSSFKVYPPVLMRAPLLPYSMPLTAEKFLNRCGFTPGKKLEVDFENSSLAYPLGSVDVNLKPGEKPLNILIILLDSWRVDSFTGKIMPNLTARSRQGTVFRNHFSGSNCTRGGVFSLFYGIPASYWSGFLAANEEPVLMKSIREQGYELGIYSSATLMSPEFDRTVFAKVPDLRKSTQGDSKLHRDWNCINSFVKFLDSRDGKRPFFGFLFLDLLHGYEPPAEFRKIFLPSAEHMDYLKLSNKLDTLPVKNLYYNTAYYQDTMIKYLFDELDRRNVPENTVIIISGDHAQELNDSKTNTWGHNSSFSRFQTQVPMIILWPGRKPEEITTRTSHFDIAPTLMSRIFKTSAPVESYSSGQDIFNRGDRDFMIMASYNVNAIFSGDMIYGLSRYGLIKTYDINGQPADKTLSRETFQAALKELSRFYRK